MRDTVEGERQEEQDVTWYLARDGTQFGPLSDAEMRKFRELGHLRSGDLVWRSGFVDWRKADEVFAGLGKRDS
jgi:hypothetical protein